MKKMIAVHTSTTSATMRLLRALAAADVTLRLTGTHDADLGTLDVQNIVPQGDGVRAWVVDEDDVALHRVVIPWGEIASVEVVR